MKKHIVIAIAVVSLILGLVISCEEPQVNLPTQYSTPTIKGTLSIPTSQNVSASEVYVKVIDRDGNTVTVQKANADGTFVVQNLNADKKYSVLFTSVEPEFTNRAVGGSNGVGGWLYDVVPAVQEGNNVGNVKLKPLGTIKGKALIDGESEHYDITVYIPGTSYIAKTDKDGSFSIYNVPEGKYTLRYTLDDHLPVMVNDVMLVCPEDVEKPEVSVKDVTLVSNKGTVEGFAEFDGLSLHSGISIKLESEDKSKTKQASTSEDGNYIFNNVDPGRYRLIASALGYLSVSSDYFTVEPATVTTLSEKIVLYKNIGTIKGYAKFSNSSEDNSGIIVSFKSSESSYNVVTDKNGFFNKSLKPDDYIVTASYPGYTSQSLSATVVENSTTEINMPSLPLASGTVSGFVFLSGSKEYSGVVVTLTNSNAITESYTEVSAADGSFRFTGLKKGGTYLLTYSKDGYVTDNTKSVEVTVGSVSSAGAVTLKSTVATVKGNVQLEGASTYENTTILLKNESTQYTATTDQKGGYIINRVLPGTYILYASKDGYVSAQSNEIVIEPSSDKEVELLSLSVAIKSVTGSVELELASDYSGVLVTATNLSDNTLIYSAITNSSGDFTLAGMKSGEYSIVLSCNGYNTVTLPTINVVNTTVYNLDKQCLEISRGKIAGLVKLEGYTDHSGVKVSILGTAYTSYSDTDGSFEFNVPAANYPGGLRFEKEDMETTAYAETVPVLVNSTYALKHEIEMKAVNVPVVSGTVKVGGTDNWEGVTVTIVEKPEFSFTTGKDGAWQFEHVPLGEYTLEYTRENAKKINSVLNVVASSSISVPTLEIIPDSASIEGWVSLDKLSDNSGVKVSVVTSETDKVLETTTDSSGYFYIGNLLSTGTHTVSFTKKGWNGVDRTISDLAPLSVTNITEFDAVVLTDTTAPVVSDVFINGNANSTGSRDVSISVDALEEGSGIAYYQITWNDDFSASEWLRYLGTIETTIPVNTNGEKNVSVRLKDGVGNISNAKSDSIDLVGQIRSVNGYLNVEDLHWTKDNNPYVVTGDLIIPEGRTLVIDPGVDVLFDGNYSILVRGDLHAVGTEDEPIVFRSSRDYMSSDYADDDYSGYNGYWGGISAGNNTLNFNNNKNGYDYTFVSGSIISNCIISDISTGISGNIFIENSKVVSYRDAIGNNESNGFKGVIIGSEIHGNVYMGERSIAYGNKFTATEPDFSDFLYETYHSVGQNYDYYYWYDDNGNYHDTYTKFLNANNFHVLGNNYIDGYQVRIYNYNSDSILSYNTFNNCWFNELCFYNNAINNCEFVNITKTITFSEINKMSFCNIVDCANEIVFRTNRRYTDKSTIDFQYNYWGKANTEQLKNLEKNSKNKNVSFLYDGYDNIDLSVIDWSGFVEEAWPTCGYQEDGLDNLNATVIKQVSGTDEVKLGSDISFELRMSSGEYVSDYRISQSIGSLVNKDWSSYYGECVISAEEIDYDSISDGWLTFFIQGRDNSGKETEIISIQVGCGAPIFTSFSIEEGITFTDDESKSIFGNIMNGGNTTCSNLIICKIFVDNLSLGTCTLDYWLWENSYYIYPEKLINGEHTVKVVLTDAVGDSSTKTVKFNVDRPVPVVQNVKYSSTTLGLEDTLEVSVQVLNAKHLKSIKVKSDDREIASKEYSDNGVSYVDVSFSIDGWRVGEGANDIYIELEDYAGNIVKSTSETITSDNTRPAFVSYAINDNGDNISYSASVNNTLHLKEIRLVSDGKVVGVNKFADNGELSVSVENSVERWMLNDGVHNLWIEAVDYADNITKSDKKQITVSGTDFVVQSYELTKERFEATLDYVIENAEHLKEISVYADGNLVGYELFNNYGDSSVSSSVTIDTWKLKDGKHNLRIEIVDYSDRREVIDNIELVVTDVNPYVKSFVANVVEDTIEIDLSLSNTKHIDYLCIYVDERCEYDWLNDESVVYDAERHYVLETNNINVGQHSVYAQIVYKGDTYINTEKYYVKTALYEPRISSLTFDKTNLSADDNLKIDLSIINARHVEWIAVCSDYDGNNIYYEPFSNNGVGQISKSISIPSGFIGRNGKHTVWVEVKKYGSDDTIKSRKTEIILDDVEPRATKLEAKEDGDNILLDLSAVNMKGMRGIEVWLDGKLLETYTPSSEMPLLLEKSFTYEKWKLGDGEHTFTVYAKNGPSAIEIGNTSITITGVDPTVDSFTVSKDTDYVTSKLMLSNAEHIVYMRVLYDGQEQNSYSYDEGENTSLIQITKIDVSALGDGEHKIKFRLTDSLGRDYETEERTVTLTGTKPEISKCDVEVVEDQIKMDIKVDNAYRIYYLKTYLDGEILREEYIYDKRAENYEETWFFNVKDEDSGLHSFRVEVIDYNWNNCIKTPYVEVNLIKYVPVFESVSLDKTSLTGDETATINFTLNNTKYINQIDITCDGRNVYSENIPMSYDSIPPTITRSIKLDSWILGDGDHSIVVSVTENDGKTTSSEPMSISVEGSIVEITNFETSQTDELLKFNISLIRTEHLKEVRVLSDGNVVVSENYENGAISSLDKVFSIEKWKLGDGEHTVYVEAEDYAGNVIKTEKTTVNVTGANISVSSFTITGVENSIKLNLELSNASHLKTIRTYVDGQSIKTENFIDKGPSIYSYEYSINKYTLQDGNHRFRMDIEDYNGNRVKTEELVFMVTGTEAKLISYSVERIEDEIVFSGELNHTNGVGSYNYFFDSSYLTGEYRDGNTKFSKSFNFDRIDNGNHRFFMEINFVNGSTIRTKDTILNIYDYKPVITECSFNKTDVNMLEDFDLTLSLQDTKHLKEIRVLSNGSTLYSKSFDDNSNGSYDSVITLNSRYFTTGTYDIVVEVEDYKENIASKNLELNVVSNEDNGPEIVNFGLVDGTEYTENNVQVFDFSINDDGGVKTVEITLDGASSLYHFEADTYRDSYKSIPITLRLRIPYIVNGEHSILVETTDFAGNKTNLSRTFNVNKVLPEIVLTEYGGPNSVGLGYYASMDSSSWVYDFALYVDGTVSNYDLLNRSEENNGFGIYPYVYFDGLSEGNHTVYAKARMQSGEEIVSNSLSLTINRDVDKNKYGEGVTWNSDGTLIDDSSTLLLWNFDSDNPAYETVNGEKMGTVYETEVGLGNNSGRLYVDKSMKLLFPNSTWTVEYWAKNNSDMLNSEIDFYMRDILYSCFRRCGSASSSYYQTEIYYENMFSEITNDYICSDISSRRDTSEWHHYAIVSTGTGFEIYVDGIRRRFTEGDKPSVRVSTGIRIEVPEGAYIDELRISDKARTVDELWDYVQYVRENNLLP